MRNALYYGDNIDVLPQHVKDESVDLVLAIMTCADANTSQAQIDENQGAILCSLVQ